MPAKHGIWMVACSVAVFLVVCSVAVFLTARKDADEQGTRLPPGAKAVWDMSSAYRETTPTRQRICVNGLWRWQPADGDPAEVPSDNWGHFKVPGPWPGIESWIQSDSQTVHRHPAWRDANLSEVTSAWYQREVSVPTEWKGRRITLSTENLNSYAIVYLDGSKVGSIYFPAGEVDITSACRPGEKQVLSLKTRAAPLDAVMKAEAEGTVPKAAPGQVPRRGLCGDVFLNSTVSGARLEGLKIDTSVRRWDITFHADLTGLRPDKEYRLKAEITDDGRVVKEFSSSPFTEAGLRDGRFSFTERWQPEKLWDIHTPRNMYHVQVSLLESAGKVQDVLHPIRFGFREFWSMGRDFYLNGTRIHLAIIATDNAQTGAAWSSYEGARECFLREKAFGVNLVYTHNYGCTPGSHIAYDEILRAADDVGMLVSFSMPHLWNYDWKAPDADKNNGYARHAAFYVQVAQNHPSVVMYSMNHNALHYPDGANPDLIDGLRDAQGKIGPRTDEKYLNGMRTQSIVEHHDDTRVVYHHSSDNLGRAYTMNIYLGWIPIQEVSEWFGHWSTEGVKPLILTEFSTPYPFDWTMYRNWYEGKMGWTSVTMPWEYCVGEWNSTLLGDIAFDLPEMDKKNLRVEAAKWRAGEKWQMWDYPYAIVGPSTVGNKMKQEAQARYITDNWRAFRTYGVSATNEFCFKQFWSLRDGMRMERQDLTVDWDNLQKPGFSPDYLAPAQASTRMDMLYEASDWVPGPGAEALLRNNMPLLAYIGGRTERFTTKDHNFCPGETFQKQIIIINNSRATQTCDYSWALALPRPITGSGTVAVQTGDQTRIPLQFALPADLAPGSYDLTMTVKFSDGDPQEDAFQIHVPAPRPALKAGLRVAIFDPKGQTAKQLQDMGMSGDPVVADADLDNYDLLIVGKNALTPDGPGPDVSMVRDGLKVIMFEQTAEVLEKRFGFRVTEYGLRNAFTRVPDHPILAGLSTENLRDWRGQATLTPPRLEPYVRHPDTEEVSVKWCGIYVSRPWRCGNWGNVSSVMIEKPTRGDFLPIVDGGFSLQYSPLMVYREGKGLMLLCQMDVTGRTEQDPVAERLVSNMLDYVATCAEGPRRNVLYVGEDAGKEMLDQTGLSPVAYRGGKPAADQVLVVGPGPAPVLAANADSLRQWIKDGGNVLALSLDEEQANVFLPFVVHTRKAEHLCTVFPPPGAKSLLAGVGPAEVHNRDPRPMDLVTGGATVVGNGVLAEVADANVVFCQMAPWQFDYKKSYNQKRTFRRTAYLVARVLGNMGASASTPLLERCSKPPETAEPWLDSFYLDKPEELDDPYRYFSW